MKKYILTTALVLGLAACNDRTVDADADADNGAMATGETSEPAGTASTTTTTTTSSFPTDARIVQEDGVTWRINADGTRVRLGDRDARIVIEGNNRYRVEPDGNRVRIDAQGRRTGVDLPDVDVGINSKGNLDVDVGDRDPDGGR